MRIHWYRAVLLATALVCGPLSAQPPYPQLAQRQRVWVDGLMAEIARHNAWEREQLRADDADPGADQTKEGRLERERVQQGLELQGQWIALSRNLVGVLQQGRLRDAAQLTAQWEQLHTGLRQLEDDLEAADAERISAAQGWLLLAMGNELELGDAAFDWIAAQIRHTDTSAAREYLFQAQLRRAGRALRMGRTGAARGLLQAMVDSATADCLRGGAAQAGAAGNVCDWLTARAVDSLSLVQLLEQIDQTAAGASRPLPAKPSSQPFVVDGMQRRRCGNSMVRGAEAALPDAVNLAVGMDQQDRAIALLLHAQILASGAVVDPRLPDLLFARYGRAAALAELVQAEQRIEQRETRSGRIVSTQVFGHTLQLPSASALIDGTRRDYSTLAEHQANLRASALVTALDPQDCQ